MLGGLAAALACLHAAAGSALAWRAGPGADPWAALGSADGSALGLMAPLLLSAAAVLAATARPAEAVPLRAAAALALLAAADLLDLPARLAPATAVWLDPRPVLGVAPVQVGAVLAGAALWLVAAALVAVPGRAGLAGRGARRAVATLLGSLGALSLASVLLSGWLPRAAAPLLDLGEEAGEALAASQAFVSVLAARAGRPGWLRDGTNILPASAARRAERSPGSRRVRHTSI
jgi:hypothetical protein